MFVYVWVFDSTGSESSSRVKLAGDRPPPARNGKSCASFGWASLTTDSVPRLLFVKVQVVVSLALRTIAVDRAAV